MENNKWSFEDTESWKVMFPNCAINNQSPVNISTDSLLDCDKLCELSMKYVPSKCKVYKQSNIPMIDIYNKNSFGNKINKSSVTYKQRPYNLEKITIHTPSMHTIDGEKYAVEICLWHNINDLNCVAISCLFQEGDHHGNPEEFINEVINYFPKENIKIPKDVDTSKKWNPMNLIPKNKSFFNYKGSIPFPPCGKVIGDENQVVHWIVFEEIGRLGIATIEMLQYNIGNNSREVQPLGKRKVYYNNNRKLVEDDESSKITAPIEVKDEKYLKCVPKLDLINKTKVRKIKQPIEIDRTRMKRETRAKIQAWSWWVVILGIMYCSYRFVVVGFKTGFLQKILQSRASAAILANANPNDAAGPPKKGGSIIKNLFFKLEQYSSRYFDK